MYVNINFKIKFVFIHKLLPCHHDKNNDTNNYYGDGDDNDYDNNRTCMHALNAWSCIGKKSCVC